MSHAGYHTKIDCTCTDCVLRYPKQYHMHTWNDFRKLDRTESRMIDGKKFNRTVDAQEVLCRKYNITLLYYRTKWQRRFDRVEHIFNLIKGGLKKFKGKLDEQHVKNQKRRKKKRNGPKINIKDFSMSEKDYTALTGRSTNDDLSFITGRNKKTDMSFITGPNKKTDYSFITGKGKRKTPSFGFEKKDYSSLTGKSKILGSRKNNIRGTVKRLMGK